jgi:hypothetical protein
MGSGKGWRPSLISNGLIFRFHRPENFAGTEQLGSQEKKSPSGRQLTAIENTPQ